MGQGSTLSQRMSVSISEQSAAAGAVTMALSSIDSFLPVERSFREIK